MDVFDLFAKISLDTSEYEEGLSGASNTTSSFADKLKSGLATAAKVGAAAITAASGAIVALTKQSVDGYAEYEQLVGGVETLFKDSNIEVLKYANDAFKTAGLSANEYMDTVTSFSASLLQSLDNDTAKAAEKANLAITDMADNANKMGTSMESIQNAYQGFAKANYTMLDNLKLGYGGTKEEMARLLEDAQAISGIEYDISSYADVVDAIHVIQTEIGITGTTAKEASTTIQGSVASMKAAWTNFLTGMADPEQEFEDLLENLIGSVVTVGENIIPRIQALLPRLVSGVTELAQNLIPYIPETLNTLLPTLIEGATALINGFTGVLPDIITAAVQSIPQLVDAAVSIVGNLVSALIEAAPQILDAGIQLIDQFTGGIETGIPDMVSRIPQIIEQFLNFITENLPSILEKGVEILNSLVNGILAAIPEFVSHLPEIITAFVNFVANNLPTIVESGISLLLNLVVGIIKAIPELVKALPQIITAIVQGIASLMGSVVDVGKNIVKGIWEGIQAMASWIKDKVTGFFSGIVSSVKGVLGIKSPSKVFAGIGGFMAEGLGEGWDDEYRNIKKQIEGDVNFGTATVDFASSGIGQSSKVLQSAILSSSGSQTPVMQSGNYQINLVLPNGTKIASWLVPILKNYDRAYGV